MLLTKLRRCRSIIHFILSTIPQSYYGLIFPPPFGTPCISIQLDQVIFNKKRGFPANPFPPPHQPSHGGIPKHQNTQNTNRRLSISHHSPITAVMSESPNLIMTRISHHHLLPFHITRQNVSITGIPSMPPPLFLSSRWGIKHVFFPTRLISQGIQSHGSKPLSIRISNGSICALTTPCKQNNQREPLSLTSQNLT